VVGTSRAHPRNNSHADQSIWKIVYRGVGVGWRRARLSALRCATP